ncbi:MAG: ABC transporter substrate-binding protein [Rhodobacterales bacterium]|nr:ABC transporter substrate-binding protein [Rhodobacterales bacterium]
MCISRFCAALGAVALILAAFPVSAFEVEERHFFPAIAGDEVLRIISTADEDAFEPIIRAYQAQNPAVAVDYTIASSTEVMRAIYDEGAAFDLVISSAMDLQTKLANDGFALAYTSAQTETLPDWAIWRDQVFSFTQEPAVLVVSEAFFAEIGVPKNRRDLINLLRRESAWFKGRVGTYDVRTSGLGYLFATQDSRNIESYWRLTELMGGLKSPLYCCSSDMIRDVASGKLAFAYNVLGSYAASRLPETKGFHIVELEDFTSVMLRTVLMPVSVENQSAAHRMIDFLVTMKDRPDLVAASGLPPVDEAALDANTAMRPIRLGPGLLVFLDRLKRDRFLENWENSIVQD